VVKPVDNMLIFDVNNTNMSLADVTGISQYHFGCDNFMVAILWDKDRS